MSIRLVKELRELQIILIGTLLLIVVPFLLKGGSAAPFGIVAFGLGCAVLGGCSFGNEFQHRTLALLLAQPISRSALWRDKMLVLGTSIAISLGVLVVCRGVCGASPDEGSWPVLVLIALCAFCGAPYWTLVCRQSLVGMVCAAGFPASLLAACALIGTWLGKDPPVELIPAVMLLTLYCALVFWRGHARFKTLEVVDVVTRELSLPAGVEAALDWPLTTASSRFRGPFASLLKKEFRLQQPGFLVAGIFFLIAVLGFGVFLLYRPLGVGILGGDFATFVLVLPLITGAIAVAEEKGWGLSEWHLSLPPSALQQWSAKMLATLPISLGLGLLLPAVMFVAGEALVPREGPRVAMPALQHLAPLVLAQLLLTSVAVYGASISRTTLRAILTALGLILLSWAVLVLTMNLTVRGALPLILSALLFRGYSGLPVLYASLVLLLGLTQWFEWSNFRRSEVSRRRVALQLVLLLLAVALCSTVIFNPVHLASR